MPRHADRPLSAAQALAAAAATAAGLVAIALDHLTASSAFDDSPLAAGLAGAVTLGFAVLLFVGLVPRARVRDSARRGDAETALVTSVVGFLSVASAWKGLPFVLGAGGAMLGMMARRRAPQARGRTMGGFAIGIGAAAVALGTVTVVL